MKCNEMKEYEEKHPALEGMGSLHYWKQIYDSEQKKNNVDFKSDSINEG